MLGSGQRLGHDVGEVVFAGNVHELEGSCIALGSMDVMEFHFYVPCLRLDDSGLNEGERGEVVDEDPSGVGCVGGRRVCFGETFLYGGE